jgi:hypothetical protein
MCSTSWKQCAAQGQQTYRFENLVCWDILPAFIGVDVVPERDKNRFCHSIWCIEVPIAAFEFALPLSNRILTVDLLFKVRKGVTS